jgi:hypothetical protein
MAILHKLRVVYGDVVEHMENVVCRLRGGLSYRPSDAADHTCESEHTKRPIRGRKQMTAEPRTDELSNTEKTIPVS